RCTRHVGRHNRTHHDRERETTVQNRLSFRLRCRSALGNFLGFPRFSGPRFGRRSSPVSSSLWREARLKLDGPCSFPINSWAFIEKAPFSRPKLAVLRTELPTAQADPNSAAKR